MQRYWKQLPASVWCQEFVKLMHERGTSIEWIKKTWHPYLDKMKDDFEKDGSQYCSHFLLKNREIASYICYFPVWNGLATAH